jgi:hypothetical protein
VSPDGRDGSGIQFAGRILREGAARRAHPTETRGVVEGVALASDMLFLAGQCHQALIPERWAGDDAPYATAGIRAAASVMERARHLMESAVIAAYESGLTWDQIDRALSHRGADGVTRQSAHARYAPAVAEFREQLAGAAGRAAQGLDPGKTGWTRICDTAFYAPYLDEVAAPTEHPGMLAPPTRPGDFLAGLSIRPPPRPPSSPRASAARTRRRRTAAHTQSLDDPYLDDGTRGWLACTLLEGHPGRHQLAVASDG